jgi:hypothetical protein
MTNGEKDKLFKQLIAEKLEELIHEFESCFDGIRMADLQRKIDACNELLNKISIRRYYAN